jgi:hypothetical protein
LGNGNTLNIKTLLEKLHGSATEPRVRAERGFRLGYPENKKILTIFYINIIIL